MFIQYHNLDIAFSMEQTRIQILNIAMERLERIIPSHRHGEGSYELHYNAEGYGQVRADNRFCELSPGMLYLVGPQVAHTQLPDPEHPSVDYCIYFKLSSPGHPGTLIQRFENHTFWIGEDRECILPLIEKLFDELRQRREGYTVWVESLLKQLLVSTIRCFGAIPSENRERFQAATPEKTQAFVIEEAFLYEYPWLTLERLAARLSLSPRQTQRLLRERYGKTFLQKRNEARMSAASILLTRSARSIADIAEELGYSAPEHFTVAFRQYYALSPTQYRRRFGVSSGQGPLLDPPDGLSSAQILRKEV